MDVKVECWTIMITSVCFDLSRAPHLLAALLGRGSVAPQLLPLLAEPAARALRGLSITARHAHPSAAAPFLQVLFLLTP